MGRKVGADAETAGMGVRGMSEGQEGPTGLAAALSCGAGGDRGAGGPLPPLPLRLFHCSRAPGPAVPASPWTPQRAAPSLTTGARELAHSPAGRRQRGPGLWDPGSGDGGPGAMFYCSSSSSGRGGGGGSGGGGPGGPSLAGSLLRLLHLLPPRRGSP